MIIYLDTETTGLYPGEICQLSYIMQDKTGVMAKNFFFAVEKVEYGAFLVHGFSPQILKTLSGGKVFKDSVGEIEKDFSAAKVLVAHNFSFDCSFLREEFSRAGKTFTFNDSFCSMKNSVGICKIPRRGGGYKYPKLSELTAHFFINDVEIRKATEELFGETGGYHDARFDTAAVYLAMNCAMQEEKSMEKLKELL